MNIEAEHAALERMTAVELRARHTQVFGEETRSGNKPYLVKRILWRMQANAEQREQRQNAWFQFLDSNKDGKISQSEFDAMQQRRGPGR